MPGALSNLNLQVQTPLLKQVMIAFLKALLIYLQSSYLHVLCKYRYYPGHNSFSKFCVFIHCTNTMFLSFYQCWKERERKKDEYKRLYSKVEHSLSQAALRKISQFRKKFPPSLHCVQCLVSGVQPKDFILESLCLSASEVTSLNSNF